MSPAANSNGWHKSPVTVTFTCSDAGSGIKTCPAAVTRDADAANLVVSGTATDVAGNTASASVTLNIDRTLPTIAVALTPPPAGGWISTILGDRALHVHRRRIWNRDVPGRSRRGDRGGPSDHHRHRHRSRGNTASVTSPAFDVDFTPPSITYTMDPPSNADGWNSKGPVTVSFQCSDGASGVANCPAPRVVAAETAQKLVTVAATDRAGNSGQITATVNLDRAAPFVSSARPPDNRSFTPQRGGSGIVFDTLSSVVQRNCNDITATVAATNVNCTVTLTPGPNTMTATAWDAAGNVGRRPGGARCITAFQGAR